MAAGTGRSDHPRGARHRRAADLLAIPPIVSMDELGEALDSGHPVLEDTEHGDWKAVVAPWGARTGVLYSEAGTAGEVGTAPDTRPGLESEAGSRRGAGAAASHAERVSSRTVALDRLRGLELVDLAVTALSLARTEDSSRRRLEDLFEVSGSEEDSCTSEQGVTLSDGYEAFGTHAEYLLTTEHEATVSALLSTRTGTARKRVGQAVTAFVGMPLTLRTLVEGHLRFNRWEAIVRRIESLSLAHLRALDVFIVGMDARYSLGQFTRRVCRFLADLVEKPVLAARIRSQRTAWVEDLPDGESIGSIRGPTPLVHAWFQQGYALSTAALKRQFAHVDVTPIDKQVVRTDDRTDAAESTPAPAPGSNTPMTSVDDLPPLDALTVDDERQIRQMMFDVITAATPRTETVLEDVDEDAGTTTRHRVGLAFSDEASVLRKQASVVVTVPMTTLMGVDDRPGTIAGSPVPADIARMVASNSTVWYRMLTDPVTGRVLDEPARTYEPDRATRIAVRGKWQTCTAPGCSRPALECEIDHGTPFNHHQPEFGGRTEPANLHPLCKRHHQAKTEGRLRMRRVTADEIEWVMPIGTTCTTVAPFVDDGGILSAACAPEDSPKRADARRTVRERVVTDPMTGAAAADAVLAGAWQEFTAESARRERRDQELAAQRAEQRAALAAEWQRVTAWPEAERVRLGEWEAHLRRRSLDVARRDERVSRDERLVALSLAEEERTRRDPQTQRSRAAGLTRNGPHISLHTIIPMSMEVFEHGRGVTSSLHSPLFGSRAARAAQRREIEEFTTACAQSPGGLPPGASLLEDRLAQALHDCLAERVPDVELAFGRLPSAGEASLRSARLRQRLSSLRRPAAAPPHTRPLQGRTVWDDDPPPF